MKIAAVPLFSLVLSTLALSTTIYVPDNYPTIQGAIDASVNGDTVIVRPGTYVENTDFVGKAITVHSEQGASVTTIDGSKAGSVVTFQNGEGLDTVLEGFSITNGLSSNGGGIYCYYSEPTIADNSISENTAADGGGGIFCAHSSPYFTDNTISDNTAARGGGIHCRNSSSPLIEKNAITWNAASEGGGIHCDDNSAPDITDNTISGNSAEVTGGGIGCYYTDPTITNNIISENTAKYGGGIDARGNLEVITGNTILKNTADYNGGGIFCRDTSPEITNNIIMGNSGTSGGGLYCYSTSSPVIVNNTFSDNTASEGGGIFCRGFSSPTITNTILWRNNATIGPEIFVDSGIPTVTYSDVEEGWPGTSNIDADPLLVQGHLTFNSPCKNAGTNSAPGIPTEDCDGDPRIAQGTGDIGADEFYYHLFCAGEVVPGGTIEFLVTGLPPQTVRLGYSSSYQFPPLNTPHGPFYLTQPLVNLWTLPDIRPDGFLRADLTVPTGWMQGEEYYFQAFLGPWYGPNSTYSQLTNPIVLTVE